MIRTQKNKQECYQNLFLSRPEIFNFILFRPTRGNLRQLKFEALDNPEHTPGILSFIFHEFQPIMSFGRHRFAYYAEVKKVVQDWLHTDSQFFSNAVGKLACGPLDKFKSRGTMHKSETPVTFHTKQWGRMNKC